MPDTLAQFEAAALRLAAAVEFDVNGQFGKGGNGGLTSDATLRASGEVRILHDRLRTERENAERERTENLQLVGMAEISTSPAAPSPTGLE